MFPVNQAGYGRPLSGDAAFRTAALSSAVQLGSGHPSVRESNDRTKPFGSEPKYQAEALRLNVKLIILLNSSEPFGVWMAMDVQTSGSR